MMNKIMWYNPYNMDYIKDHCKEYIINEDAFQKTHDLVSSHYAPVMDRTETIKTGFNFKNNCPIPDFTGFNKKLDDIIIDRAIDLISKGEIINVFWSGGIDSTTVLVALLKVGIKKDQLRIISRMSCMYEYRKFLFEYILNKLNFHCYDINTNPFFFSHEFDGILLTGEHGDQLFGSVLAIKICDKYKCKLDSPYEQYLMPKYHDTFYPIFEKAPIEIKTIQDYYWWLNFVTKWNDVRYRCNAFTYSEIDRKYIAFFDTEDFQKWSMTNHYIKAKSTIESYKMPLKEFIYSFTNDKDYTINKIKISSVQYRGDLSLCEYDPDILFINENFNLIRKGINNE
jgi:hypothetical protein